MANNREARRRLRHYLQQNGRCYWCGCEMLLVLGDVPRHDAEERFAIKKLRQLPYFATLDHIDSRLSSERGQHEGEIRKVAACRQCNHERAAREQAQLPLEELHLRSGRSGKGASC